MKTIFRLFLPLVLGLYLTPAFAQNDRISQLENEMRAASGTARADKLIALADANMEAGDYKKALEWAEEAESFAKNIRQPELRALALNRQGKALLVVEKRGLFGKKRPAPRFEESFEILRSSHSGNRALMRDNLENLRQLASKAGRDKDVALIEGQIAVLDNGGAIPAAPIAPAIPEAPVTKQEFRQAFEEMNKKILEQQSSHSNSTKERETLLREREQMVAKLAEQEAAIDKMTEEQTKYALMLMQQRYVLDSMSFRSSLDSLAVSNWNLAVKEAESSRNMSYAITAALALLFFGSLYSFVRARQNAKILEEKNKIIRAEQERSENLLLNILPSLVADELKKQGRTSARYYEDVSVLFADFVGFSKITELLTPQQLVSELDTCFQAFDQIIAKYDLEKIKTIGDAYMCAGGLPNGGGSQLRDMVSAARDMQAWLTEWNGERDKVGLPCFIARIGIHRGPVVAGVVGSKKFAFDIWGDTVNIAARIEQAGEGGKINISGEAYEVIKPYFACHYRGKIAAKNKGEIDMYFVEN